MVNYLKKVIFGSAFYFTGLLIANFLGYLVRIILARNLSPEFFGLFYSVLTFVLFFLTFRDLGTGTALARYIPKFKIKKEFGKLKSAWVTILIFQFLVSSIFVLVLWIFSGYLAQNYFKNNVALIILRVLSLYIPLSIFFTFSSTIFQGFQKNKLLSLIQPLKMIILFVSILLFLSLGFEILAPVYAYVLIGPIIFIILFVPLYRLLNPFKNKSTKTWSVFKKIIFFGIPIILVGISNKFISYFDTLMLTYFSTLKEVGIYNVVLPTALMLTIFSSSVGAIFMPIISELWTKKDAVRIRQGFNLIYKYVFILSLPVVMVVFVYADLLIKLFFGKEYLSGALALKILIIGTVLNLIAAINKQGLIGIGQPISVTKIVFIAAIANILFNLIMIPLFGINGAAIATALSYICMLFFSTRYLLRFIRIYVPLKSWLLTFLISTVSIGLIHLIKFILHTNIMIEVFLSLFVASIFYLGALYILRILDVKELISFIKKMKSG